MALPATCSLLTERGEPRLKRQSFWEERARKEIGPVPFVFLINKKRSRR